jgi:hypothetical protein
MHAILVKLSRRTSMSLSAPHEEQMPEVLARMGHEGPVSVVTANDLARSWKDLFEQVCRE